MPHARKHVGTRATHLNVHDDQLKENLRWTVERICYDDDDEKARIYGGGLDHHCRDGHMAVVMRSFKLVHDGVPVDEQPSGYKSGRDEVEHKRADAIGEDVCDGWCSVNDLVDQETADD